MNALCAAYPDSSVQTIQFCDSEYEQCFDYMKNGGVVVDVEKWIASLEDPKVKSAAAAVMADIARHRVHADLDQSPNSHCQSSGASLQQQDIPCLPAKSYWTAKCGGEVKRFEWFFVERRRWEDPVDMWLSAKEVNLLGRAVGRLFLVPMSQTTKGLMKRWHSLKIANDDSSGDIGYEQLQHLLRTCRIRAPESELKKMFEAADEDGSGSIDSVEFISIVKSLQSVGGSTGVETCNCVRAFHGPSEALEVVLACTHKSILAGAGSSSNRSCMFHVEIDANETRPCDILVKLNCLCDVLASTL